MLLAGTLSLATRMPATAPSKVKIGSWQSGSREQAARTPTAGLATATGTGPGKSWTLPSRMACSKQANAPLTSTAIRSRRPRE
eukprot:11946784-Alexandrium_andersonii.AAC.1